MPTTRRGAVKPLSASESPGFAQIAWATEASRTMPRVEPASARSSSQRPATTCGAAVAGRREVPRSSRVARAPPGWRLAVARTVGNGPEAARTSSSAASEPAGVPAWVWIQTWAPEDWVKTRCQGSVAYAKRAVASSREMVMPAVASTMSTAAGRCARRCARVQRAAARTGQPLSLRTSETPAAGRSGALPRWASSRTRPSKKLITRSAALAIRASWVTRRMVWPRRWKRASSRSTSRVPLLSRLPAGSSASSRLGLLTRARGQGHTLLFAAGELAGGAVLLAGQAQLVEQFGAVGAGLPGGPAGQQRGEFDVVGDGEVGDQVEELEDDADVVPAQLRPAGLAVGVDLAAVDPEGAAVGAVEAAEEVQEGGLAGSGGAGDRDELAACDRQVDAAYGVDGGGALGPVGLDQAGCPQYRAGRLVPVHSNSS